MDVNIGTEEGTEFTLKSLGFTYFKTGSRVICDPPVMDTDVDFCVLVDDDPCSEHTLDLLRNCGYFPINGEYPHSSVRTFRNGEVNLIACRRSTSFLDWYYATQAARALNLKDKEDRIELFSVFTGGFTLFSASHNKETLQKIKRECGAN